MADTGSWEQKLAETLEEMPEIGSYVKNQGLNFTIPYTLNGEEKQYYPDFIARVDVGTIGFTTSSSGPVAGQPHPVLAQARSITALGSAPGGAAQSGATRSRSDETGPGVRRQPQPDSVRSGSVRLQPDLTVIIEVTGEGRKDKAAKVSTAGTLWVPAVNNHGSFGRWAFVEVTDPWNAQRTIRAALAATGDQVVS